MAQSPIDPIRFVSSTTDDTVTSFLLGFRFTFVSTIFDTLDDSTVLFNHVMTLTFLCNDFNHHLAVALAGIAALKN